MITNRKKGIILFAIIGATAVCLCLNDANRNKSPYIKSDQIVYETDSIEVPHVATKEFDREGNFHLLAQLGIGKSGKANPDRDAFVVKTNVDTGKSQELYEQKDENWAYKADGWFRNYATYGDEMLCADFTSEKLTYGKPTPCLAVIDLKTQKETLWNLSALYGKAVFSEEGEYIDQLVWLNKKVVALVSGNSVMRIDIKKGELSQQSKIAEEPLANWNLSGTVLSYVVKRDGRYIFEAVDLEDMKKLVSINAGSWRPGFGEYDMLYCDGAVYKTDKKYLYRYSFEKKEYEKIYSGIKMQETSMDPNTGEKYYNYGRLYGVKKDCIYLMHVSEYAGECSFCRVHKLVLRT
ncbi:MAG: hypothetical protein HFH62_02210 [Lachnospiraceae bacterium]|nr:hypothetical protein [Lachnospiraceae bacterium]